FSFSFSPKPTQFFLPLPAQHLMSPLHASPPSPDSSLEEGGQAWSGIRIFANALVREEKMSYSCNTEVMVVTSVLLLYYFCMTSVLHQNGWFSVLFQFQSPVQKPSYTR